MFAIAIGTGTTDNNGQLLEAYFPYPVRNPSASLVQALLGDAEAGPQIAIDNACADRLAAAGESDMANAVRMLGDKAFITALPEDSEPSSTAEVYLKLTLISTRQAKPHELNLTGLFAQLPNVAWTNEGAIALDELTERQIKARAEGRSLNVESVDKFPRMANYAVPAGIRIGDASRIRRVLWAMATVMHEGFNSFNAGTAGVSMVEGRISAGVMVGEGSDLGGGCSTMGTCLAASIVISVGDQCLLGANSGLVFLWRPLLIDRAYLQPTGSRSGRKRTTIEVKARDLAGVATINRRSMTGTIEWQRERLIESCCIATTDERNGQLAQPDCAGHCPRMPAAWVFG